MNYSKTVIKDICTKKKTNRFVYKLFYPALAEANEKVIKWWGCHALF